MKPNPLKLKGVKNNIIFLALYFGVSLASHATVIIDSWGSAIFTSAPGDGFVYVVPETNPFLTFTATGNINSVVTWENGSVNDQLGNDIPENFQQPATLFYFYGIQLDGGPELTLEPWTIGEPDSETCTESDYPDETQTRTFYCGTEIFERNDLSLTATVGVGFHYMQIINEVVVDTSEIIVAEVQTITFEVVSYPVNEPSISILIASGLTGLGFVRLQKKKT